MSRVKQSSSDGSCTQITGLKTVPMVPVPKNQDSKTRMFQEKIQEDPKNVSVYCPVYYPEGVSVHCRYCDRKMSIKLSINNTMKVSIKIMEMHESAFHNKEKIPDIPEEDPKEDSKGDPEKDPGEDPEEDPKKDPEEDPEDVSVFQENIQNKPRDVSAFQEATPDKIGISQCSRR